MTSESDVAIGQVEDEQVDIWRAQSTWFSRSCKMTGWEDWCYL